MNERAERFLNKKKAEEQEKLTKQKQKLLIDLGLFDREYSSNTSYSAEYPHAEWDSQTQTSKYYKQVPIDVSDEEYEEIKKYSNIETDDNPSNPIATALTVIAVIGYIVGFIAGIVMGTELESFLITITYWCITFIAGTPLLGFAEIIKLLESIKRK